MDTTCAPSIDLYCLWLAFIDTLGFLSIVGLSTTPNRFDVQTKLDRWSACGTSHQPSEQSGSFDRDSMGSRKGDVTAGSIEKQPRDAPIIAIIPSAATDGFHGTISILK